jgi:predicted CXXCH cytochrome family protein
MIVTTIVLAAALFLYQSTVIRPGAVAAVGEATPSPLDYSAGSPTPAPAPTSDSSPAAEATGAPEPTPPSPQPTLPEPTPGVTPEAAPSPLVGGTLSIGHFTFASVAGAAREPDYLTLDTALGEVSRFAVFRLRFEVTNTSADPYTWTPQLQVAQDGGEFADLPISGDPASPFHAATEWVAGPQGGTEIGPEFVDQPATPDAPAVLRSSGLNPLPAQTMPGASVLNIEFSIAPTAGAAYEATYAFRLTDAGTELAATAARLTMAAMPPLELSPGQRPGVPTTDDGGKDGPQVSGPSYGLNPSSTSVHEPAFDLTGSTCAACHRAHAAAGSMLTASATQLSLCGSCHNGTDLPDIAAAFSSVPANDESTRTYFKHEAADLCSECHNPHDSNATPGTETALGWTPSGATYGASGASVTNTGSGPTYQLIGRVTLEYQLCFKCHSGAAATPPSNFGQPPSRQLLDKGVEFNPANLSYHPVEAAGTNQTAAMANSLSVLGTSPYKLWAFDTTSTIRCVNCHADARIAQAALDQNVSLSPSADLPVHASPERGILLAPYQDRLLKGSLAPYQAADFALCYLCHSEAPFVDQTGQVRDGQNGTIEDTNFRYHGVHLSNPDVMQDRGFPGTDIDTPGYGSGFALCAECHFRIHSSALPADGKTPGSRLVNFAPDVTAPTGGTLAWQPRNGPTAGSCTLKCHGAPHHAVPY